MRIAEVSQHLWGKPYRKQAGKKPREAIKPFSWQDRNWVAQVISQKKFVFKILFEKMKLDSITIG